MSGSYATPHAPVRGPRPKGPIWGLLVLLAVVGHAVLATAQPAPAQSAPPPAADPGAAATVKLQLLVFDGAENLTREAKLAVYPRGQRTNQIALTPSADHVFEATVPTGFYDIQVVRERRGQVVSIRWVEQVLVQNYPDEYGRNLHVLNLNATYGALQVRAGPDAAAAAKGWTAVAFAAGTTREAAKGQVIGGDIILPLPAGRYDIRITVPGREPVWMRDVDVPVDRTRLKTWSAAAPVA